MNGSIYPVSFEVRAKFGMFADPATGSESVSYPIPTSSACIGMIDSICRISGVGVGISAIATCNFPSWTKYHYNSYSISRNVSQIKKNNPLQLHESVLENPHFQVFAYFYNDKISGTEKYKNINCAHSCQEQFLKRLKRGQNFYPVSLGRKEFVATRVSSIISPIETEYNEFLPSFLISCKPIFEKNERVAWHGRVNEYAIFAQNVIIKNGCIIFDDNVKLVDKKINFVGNK